MDNYKRLVAEILERSASKDPLWAFQEWDEVFTYQLTVDEDPETCLCGKHPIYEIFKLRNRITDEDVTIGNVCIQHFREGEKLEKVFKDYKKVKKDINKRLSRSTLDYMLVKQVPGFHNYKFYSKRANKKISTLSSTELSIIRKVNQLFIDFIERNIKEPRNPIVTGETVYCGKVFKSHLAARWAVYFDVIGIKYEYASKEVILSDKKVTPDFWLPQVGMYAYVNNTKFTDSEVSLIDDIVMETDYPVLMLVGAPSYGTYDARERDYTIDSDGDYVLQGVYTVGYVVNGFHNYLWNENRFYSNACLDFAPGEENKEDFLDMFDDGMTEEAVNKAKSYKFE